MRTALAGAGPWRAVSGVAVVADELDGGHERAVRAGAGRRARRCPAEVAGQGACGRVPGGLVDGLGGDEVEGGAVAVGVVAGLARGRDAQSVGAQQPSALSSRRASIGSAGRPPAIAYAGSIA